MLEFTRQLFQGEVIALALHKGHKFIAGNKSLSLFFKRRVILQPLDKFS
jgi:hypothetical protein